MRKIFCDVCNGEIGEGGRILANNLEVAIPSTTYVNKPKFKLIPAFKTENCDVCNYCVISAVNDLDKRPRSA